MLTFLILSLLVLLHELGHFWAARKFGVKVLEFGFGLPPKLVRLGRRGGTEYTLNWLPLGGFVRLFGEDNDMGGKSRWVRFAILVAGVSANLLVGIAMFALVYSVVGVPTLGDSRVVVSQVVEGSPADLAGITEGDVVVTLAGEEVVSSSSFVETVGAKKGEMLTMYVTPLLPDGTVGENSRQVSLIPRTDPPEGEGAIGVGVVEVPSITYDKKPWYLAPFYGVVEGVKEAYLWGVEIMRGMVQLFGGLLRGTLPAEMSGPVGVWQAGEKIQDQSGILGSIRFGAILSLNLAVFNLLPIPGLDGGRILFLLFEGVFGKKRVSKYEGLVNGAGIIFLIALLIFITFKDIAKL